MAERQFVEGPEASAMESGYRLDELLRRERGARERQRMEQEWRTGEAAQAHQNRLAEMLYADRLKEQGAQREAERGAPALQALMGGNPAVARAFGYEPGQPAVAPELTRPVNPLEDEEAAAYIPRTPGSPGVERRMPTTEEAAGLVRSMPGMAQTILNKQLEGVPKANPMVVQPGAGVWNPVKGAWDVEPTRKPGAYATLEEALAVADRMEAARPELKGRMQIDQDAAGNYQLKLGTTAPLTPQDPVKEDIDDRVKRGVLSKAQAAKEWRDYQVSLAGAKTAAQVAEQPLDVDTRTRLKESSAGIEAVDVLRSRFTADQRRDYTGMLRSKLAQAALATYDATGIVPPGWTREQLEGLADFKKWNGVVEKIKFSFGGKQLTEGEQRVVEAFIPTGRETTTAEYEAKLAGVQAVLRAQARTEVRLAQLGKAYVSLEQIQDIAREELLREGVDTKSRAGNLRNQMSPRDRLRRDMGGR